MNISSNYSGTPLQTSAKAGNQNTVDKSDDVAVKVLEDDKVTLSAAAQKAPTNPTHPDRPER
ncbi:hypothetical protein ACMAZF_01230 [Psychrobium sp. nBUS_13]|uniref:hypothetical protein n=1 Tax=Psychrobium sp. nBUS_13 TaxID=3395319 RepID=UPI003EC00619